MEGCTVLAVYADDGRERGRFLLRDGDFCVLLGGGHGFQFGTDTLLLEAKLGPYPGRAADKQDLTPETT